MAIVKVPRVSPEGCRTRGEEWCEGWCESTRSLLRLLASAVASSGGDGEDLAY